MRAVEALTHRPPVGQRLRRIRHRERADLGIQARHATPPISQLQIGHVFLLHHALQGAPVTRPRTLQFISDSVEGLSYVSSACTRIHTSGRDSYNYTRRPRASDSS